MSDTIQHRRKLEQTGFAQMWHVLGMDQELSDGAYRTYATLLYHAQQKGRAWPGIPTLAKERGKSERTIKAHLEELIEKGIISRNRRFGTSSITWIEDLEQVYQDILEQTCEGAENCPIEQTCEGAENCPTNGQKTAPKEEQDKKNKQDVVGVSTTDSQIVSLLTALDISRSAAENLAGKSTLEQVQGWITIARQSESIRDPAAFVVSKLQKGELPPKSKAGNLPTEETQRTERHRRFGSASHIPDRWAHIVNPG